MWFVLVRTLHRACQEGVEAFVCNCRMLAAMQLRGRDGQVPETCAIGGLRVQQIVIILSTGMQGVFHRPRT